MKFELEIELGNEAMLNAEDVAATLAQVAHELKFSRVSSGINGNIRDINGNTVGSWEFTEAGWQPAFRARDSRG